MSTNGAKSNGGAIPEDAYSLETDTLHHEIEARAFTSGHYPYPKRMKRKAYKQELQNLQIELLKVQSWATEAAQRIVIVFEGRDAAGKGGTIKRFTQHTNPRLINLVALPKPSEEERGQWYFQRYVPHLPSTGFMSLFDRSWYNRAGVERVMGFCGEDDVQRFFQEAPEFENMLVRDGIHLFKFWFTVGREEQLRRLHRRKSDPLKQWKLSPIDYVSVKKWADYTAARQDIFRHTHTSEAPWCVIRANDKLRLRLNAMRVVLSRLAYAGKDESVIPPPDPKIVIDGDESFD